MNSDKVINATSPAGEGGLPELLADLDKYLEGCPPLTTKPAWMVKKSSRLLLRCRDVIRLLATTEQPKCSECDKCLTGYCNSCAAKLDEQPGSSVQGEAVGYVCKGGSVEWYSVDGFCLMPKPGTVLHTPPPAPAAVHVPNMSSFQIFRKPPVTPPEYFPDGSDSPIRDEARGVEVMAVAYKCPTCGAPASKTEREGVYDMHDVYTYAPSAPEPVRVDELEEEVRQMQPSPDVVGGAEEYGFSRARDMAVMKIRKFVAALAGKDGA